MTATRSASSSSSPGRVGWGSRWPKVLFWSLAKSSYDYVSRREFMDEALTRSLGIKAAPANEHEWDAALSALAALEGFSGRWTHDLHCLATRDGERLLTPCGTTHYWWPE